MLSVVVLFTAEGAGRPTRLSPVIVGVTNCVCAMLKLFIVACVVGETPGPGV